MLDAFEVMVVIGHNVDFSGGLNEGARLDAE
jgi:hypothetical protein